jgi:hypothetical protein
VEIAKQQNIKATRLRVNQGFHSSRVDSAAIGLRVWSESFSKSFQPLRITLYSTLLGAPILKGNTLAPHHWVGGAPPRRRRLIILRLITFENRSCFPRRQPPSLRINPSALFSTLDHKWSLGLCSLRTAAVRPPPSHCPPKKTMTRKFRSYPHWRLYIKPGGSHRISVPFTLSMNNRHL